MDNGLKPLECGDRVKLFMLNDRYWHGQRGTLETIETVSKAGHPMTLFTVKMDMGQRIKVERKSLIPLDSDNVNKDAELPPAIPACPAVPKDGDHISNHNGHEIVTASADGEAYKYCRTCKIEVKEGGRVMTGTNATLSIDGKVVGKFEDIISSYPSPLSGDELDTYALDHFGIKRTRGESDKWFQKRLCDTLRGLPRHVHR